MQEFAGKVAVVTGAATGVGRALAERFARAGMRVVLADIQQAALERAVAELRLADYDVVGVRTDVTQVESVQYLAERALKTYGQIHVVCNNAGAAGPVDLDQTLKKPVWEAAEKDWLWAFGVNFWGVVYGTRTFMPIMLAQDEEAHMVNTASMTGLVQGGATSGITKHAVVALTETIHGQLAQRTTKVGVSVLFPCSDRTKGTPPAADVVADLVLQAIKDRQLYIRPLPVGALSDSR